MRGRILDYSVQTNRGVISGNDGQHYLFSGANWKATQAPRIGMNVDFQASEGEAVSIYAETTSYSTATPAGGKSKIIAGVLAIMLGAFGAHKFYLGRTGPALVFLLTNTVGLAVTIFLAFIPNYALGVIALSEGILYLTKSDEEFYQLYVVEEKSWF
jgi:TM2 domain-containing membrane protein YozV